jgi:hypothetical protein
MKWDDYILQRELNKININIDQKERKFSDEPNEARSHKLREYRYKVNWASDIKNLEWIKHFIPR